MAGTLRFVVVLSLVGLVALPGTIPLAADQPTEPTVPTAVDRGTASRVHLDGEVFVAEQTAVAELTHAVVDDLPTERTAVADAIETVAGPSPVVLLPPVAYSRWDDSDPLTNDVRASIFDAVQSSPGDSVTTVATAVDVAPSTVRYHADVLVYEGLVRTAKALGERRLYPIAIEHTGVVAALSSGTTAPIVETVLSDGPLTVSALAETIDRAPSTVSHHVSRLEAVDVVDRERVGESVEVSLTDAASTVLAGGSAD